MGIIGRSGVRFFRISIPDWQILLPSHAMINPAADRSDNWPDTKIGERGRRSSIAWRRFDVPHLRPTIIAFRRFFHTIVTTNLWNVFNVERIKFVESFEIHEDFRCVPPSLSVRMRKWLHSTLMGSGPLTQHSFFGGIFKEVSNV